MKEQNDLLTAFAARLAALIERQERMLEVIRKEQAELIPVERTISNERPAKPTDTYFRYWSK